MRTTKYTVAVIVASALTLGSVTTIVAADWPSFRGPSHDGKSAENITWPKNGPRPEWQVNCKTCGTMSISSKLVRRPK